MRLVYNESINSSVLHWDIPGANASDGTYGCEYACYDWFNQTSNTTSGHCIVPGSDIFNFRNTLEQWKTDLMVIIPDSTSKFMFIIMLMGVGAVVTLVLSRSWEIGIFSSFIILLMGIMIYDRVHTARGNSNIRGRFWSGYI
jgi:hypothetical protein